MSPIPKPGAKNAPRTTFSAVDTPARSVISHRTTLRQSEMSLIHMRGTQSRGLRYRL